MMKLAAHAARLAVGAAVAAAAVTLAACVPAAPAAHPAGGRPATPASAAAVPSTAPTSAPASPPPPGGFQVLSMSFVSDQAGFALGTVGCGSRRCGALLGTTNGGATWTPLSAPARAVPDQYGSCPAGQPCAGQIRFATPLIGYAYDPALYLTTDGGRHWRLAAGSVRSLEAAGGTVVRVASSSPGCAGAPAEVDVAPPGSTAWRPLPAPGIFTICPPLLYRQGQRLVLAGYGNPAGGVRATAVISRSADGGRTWTGRTPDSCYSGHGFGADGYASAVALAPPDVLVLLCQHQGNGQDGQFGPGWTRVSVNGGASYGPDEALPLLPHQAGEEAGYQLAAASAGRLLAVEDTDGDGQRGSQVLLTVDGGVSWSTVLRLSAGAPVVLVGFEDPRTGRVAQGDTVWTTRDGGRAWRADRF
jgi:hypothetical protein